MPGAVERIVRSGVAYQAAAFLSAGLAFFTFNAYTTAIGVPTLGQADLILAWLILASIVARLGFGEALLRHWFTASDAERPRLQRTIQGSVLAASSVVAAIVWLLAPTIEGWLSLINDVWVVRVAALGVLAYTNLDMAQTLLRARDDRRTYLVASISNVLLTVLMTILLVLVFDQGVLGYLIGNYAASGLVLLWLWSRELPVFLRRVTSQPALVDPDKSLVVEHAAASGAPAGEVGEDDHPVAQAPDAAAALSQGIRVETVESEAQTRAASRGDRRALLRFGLPTIPTDAAIFGFNILDRTILAAIGTAAVAEIALGVFSSASKIAAGVILIARAFQLAFPPLAYSIESKVQASNIYASALRGYAVVLGGTVAGVALCAPWTVDVLIGVKPGDPDLRAQIVEVLPLLAAAWSLWGVVPVMTTIAGRIGATELTVPAALVGLAVNVVALVVLVPPYGAHGAAAALVIAYVVLIFTLHLLTRRHFPVAFD
ncbi:MAG: polysaccharide biosynthesis C-terminal domain-containing protein, partial [Solirubrobacteraceae bacterium]|nr:polysaccharide biosynthesis C-terminal domain-containing protein [Solirubrobacteraceae bacterium]